MTIQGMVSNQGYIQAPTTDVPPQSPLSENEKAGVSNDDRPILPTAGLFDAVGVVLDLSMGNRDVLGAYDRLNKSEQRQFLDIIASVLDQGVVGTETLEVRGEAQRVFVSTRLGDAQLRHARPYPASSHIDLRV